MKLIIAGSRNFTKFTSGFICEVLNQFEIFELSEVVSGGAKGIDSLGEKFAKELDGLVNLKVFPADWDKHGKSAGPIRNKQMADYADALLLIWNGESRGSANMKLQIQRLNKPIYEIIIKGIQ